MVRARGGEALIELAGIRRSYRKGSQEVQALRGLDLRIGRGEFLAIMGPSGSGKSTLMHVLGCMDRPDQGSYRLEGEEVAALGDDQLSALRNRKIGFVFQGSHLLPRQTAWENVAMPLLYAGLPARERKRRALELLARVGLTDRAHHRPNQLSGGQQQRVAIARALVNRPRLLLADEPTGNLDSATGAEILAEFQRLHRDGGLTVVLVTHDPTVAQTAERVVTLRDGQIVGDTTSVRLPE